jgi:hypothetical protein
MATQHRLDPTPETVHWGLFRRETAAPHGRKSEIGA